VSYMFRLNGSEVNTDRGGMIALVDVLREDLHLTGAKPACREGRCGACTVLLDGHPAVSCLLPLALIDGRDVKTVEGVSGTGGELSPLQAALLDHGGVQCGACTPGIVMALTAYLQSDAPRTASAVAEALSGNICRCTGYVSIIAAALAAADGVGGAA
jgi:aerobic-type carbon monoxide dehydrogenase small subunit (CoxS/CutS family)